jgi:hypothetical protein
MRSRTGPFHFGHFSPEEAESQLIAAHPFTVGVSVAVASMLVIGPFPFSAPTALRAFVGRTQGVGGSDPPSSIHEGSLQPDGFALQGELEPSPPIRG